MKYDGVCMCVAVCVRAKDRFSQRGTENDRLDRQRIFKNNIVMQQINVTDAQNHFNSTLQIWKNDEIFTPFRGRISNLNQSRKTK